MDDIFGCLIARFAVRWVKDENSFLFGKIFFKFLKHFFKTK